MPPPSRYDLHTHSNASDGLLAPAELVERASGRGVEVLALTDHDEVSGLAEARDAAARCGLHLVCGTELSASWRTLTIHVVGLGIDPDHAGLREGIANIRSGRLQRGRLIGESLAHAGIPGAYEGALHYATNEELLSRTHFARFLVEAGHVGQVRDVFRRYLTPGRPGYVEHRWASLEEAIGLIRAAGGHPVLAHPGRYKTDRPGLRALLGEFRDAGGRAIEVVTSSHTAAQYEEFAGLARVFGFLASCGSDFHGPGESWMDLGVLPALPGGLRPVWQEWDL